MPALVVGVGGGSGVGPEEVLALVHRVLAEAGSSASDLAALATVEAKAAEGGLIEAAERLGVPLRTFPAGMLALVEVPNPSRTPLAAVGTPSVAEAAALAASDGGALLVSKRKSVAVGGGPAKATAAVARRALPAHVRGTACAMERAPDTAPPSPTHSDARTHHQHPHGGHAHAL
ncbi:cobalamin biosynthesis protein [Streptomyces sp. URMC 123]|uniref:cobalamin biosynthesis protein n=1 Tax=Streptomyces sp. URMC 123 TaxID=3423403 RepID=UPI003F1B1897